MRAPSCGLLLRFIWSCFLFLASQTQRTALMWASSLEIGGILLLAGADTDIVDKVEFWILAPFLSFFFFLNYDFFFIIFLFSLLPVQDGQTALTQGAYPAVQPMLRRGRALRVAMALIISGRRSRVRLPRELWEFLAEEFL